MLTMYNAAGDTKGKLVWQWKPGNHNLGMERDSCSSDCNQNFGNTSVTPKTGVWETWEMYIKFDHVAVNDGGQGRVRAYKNGVLIGDLTDRPTMWSVNGGSPQTQDMWFDDLVITTDTPTGRDAADNAFIGLGSVSTKIPSRVEYSFPRSDDRKITVFDVSGQRIDASLIKTGKPRRHGVYFITGREGDRLVTKKIVVLR